MNMKDLMSRGWRWLSGSFENRENGASAKKLTVFVFVGLVVWIHYVWLKSEFVDELMVAVLGMDLGFIAVLLGVATYQQVTRKKEEKADA